MTYGFFLVMDRAWRPIRANTHLASDTTPRLGRDGNKRRGWAALTQRPCLNEDEMTALQRDGMIARGPPEAAMMPRKEIA